MSAVYSEGPDGLVGVFQLHDQPGGGEYAPEPYFDVSRVQVRLERYGLYDPGPAPHPVMHRLTELDMDRQERADLERAWQAGEISGQRCERYIRVQDGARCLHTAVISITGMCVHEHQGTVLLCFCCAVAARASRMRCASTGCGEPVTVVRAESLHPAPPDREELIG